MSYRKKVYRNNKKRGGVKGKCVDTAFGAPGNLNTSKKNYPRNPLGGVKK